MTIKKKTSKKVLKRKRNPDLKSDYAFQMGYRIGKDDIAQKQWELDDIYQSYVANISYLLINNEFRWSILNYQNWILGYIQVKLDFKYSDKLNELYYKIKNDKNYLNPVLADHSRVLLLIDQEVNKIKEDTLDYVNKNKIQWNKINSISIRLNQDESYTQWILENLLKLKYITKSSKVYELTRKGYDVIYDMSYLNLNRLDPSNYKIMKDLQEYLEK